MTPELAATIAQVVREVVSEQVQARRPLPAHNIGAASTQLSRTSGAARPQGIQPTGPSAGAAHRRTETVPVANDKDLQSFAFRLLEIFDNPKSREDFRAGRLKFSLAGRLDNQPLGGAAERIESGAVTERIVKAAATRGVRLVLGKRAVITPLARETARALGVLVEKEKQ